MSAFGPSTPGGDSELLGTRVPELGQTIGQRLRRLGLVARFALVAVPVALLVASWLAWVMEGRVTSFALDQLRARAMDQVRLGLHGKMDARDFEPPFTPKRQAELAARLDPLLSPLLAEGSGVARLHVFARDGTVIYSDLVAKRGQVASPAAIPLLQGALNGAVGAKLSDLSSPENADLKPRYGSALEVYVPLELGGRVVGAYELYQDLAPIRPIRPMVWGAVLGGFTILLLSLYGVIRWAAGVIQQQQAEREAAVREAAESEQRALRASEARFRSLIASASDVCLIVSGEGRIGYQSPSAERAWGYAEADLAGRPFQAFVHPDDLPAAMQLLAEARTRPGLEVATELRVRRSDDEWRELEVIAKDLTDDPSIRGIVVTLHDVTEHKAFARELRHMAFHDALTALPNRALFIDRVEHALARAARHNRRVAVAFLDLDNFKVVNDSLGHEAGDQLLIEVAGRICDSLRPGDTVARLGGDEFTFLLEDIGTEAEALRAIERLGQRLRQPADVQGRQLFPGASIGLALGTPGQDQAEDLLRNADLAMYHAKADGKNRCAVFDPTMNADAVERLELESDLHGAIERGEFRVVYQPIMALGSTSIRKLEALLRWDHPRRGLIPPGRFIPLAEETGLIVALGRWVLEEACRRVRAWQLELPLEPPLSVCVNLSPRQFREPELVADVEQVLRETDLDPACLELEITEGAVMVDREAAVSTLWALRELGVRLAIDDFGTGYSSLSYLKHLPVDTVKIDRSFVSGLGQDANDGAIVQGVIALAKTLHLTVTGEGIETTEQLGQLRALGCDHGQGYFIARPLPQEAVAPLLASQSPGGVVWGDRDGQAA